MPKWVTRIKNDFLMKQFIPLKILHFFMIGGMTTLFPFLTIQARSLGITGEELGIIYSLLPVVGIFGPSLAGLIADKIGNFKLFLSISVMCSGLAALLFIAIPPGRIQRVLPEHIPLSVQCSLGPSKVVVDPPITCDIKNDLRNSMINISTCFYECSEPTVEKLHSVDEFLHSWCINSGNCQLFEEIELSDNFGTHYEVEGRRLEPGQESQIQRNLYLYSNSSLEMTINLNDSESSMKIHEPFCPDFKQFLESSDELFPSRKENASNEKTCLLKCNAFGNSAEICSNKKYTETLNPILTIIVYILVRLINSLTLASSFTLFEGAVVAILKEHNGDIGLQRVYGNLGQIVMTPISGKLIDYFSHLNEKEDYNPAFFLYCALKFLCAFIFLFINLEFKQPSKRVMKDFKELIVQPRVSTFIFFTMVIGTSYGFVETFLFWLLEDLGADKSLMGVTVTVGAAFGIPLLMMSAFFIQKLGHVNTLTLCAFIYVIRFVGYSLINNPWLAMPFEALESFTNSLMTVTSISYAGSLSQPSTVASMQGLYAGTYHGFGRGVGSLAGGIMIKRLGNRTTFQVLGASCGIIGVIYFIVNKIFFTKKLDEVADDSVVKGQGQDGEATGNKSLEMDGRKSIATNAATDYGTNSTENGDAGRENLAFAEKP